MTDEPREQRFRRLPARRVSRTYEGVVGGQKFYLTVGEYEDGSVGEIFIDMHKEGASYRALLNAFAIVVSKDLQYGVPLAELVDTYVGTRFEPHGVASGHELVRWATSIPDYIFRVLAIDYLGREELATDGPPEFPWTSEHGDPRPGERD